MSVTVRKAEQHTYSDYLQWPEDRRCELIDGVAFAMAPAPSRRHQRLVGELFRAISDALDWLVHPVDRVVTIYRLENGAYGRAVVQELLGRSSCTVCAGVEIDWGQVVKGLPDGDRDG